MRGRAQSRRGHEARIIDLLRRHGALTRAELSAHTGITRSTVSEIVGSLLDRGAIVPAEVSGSGATRGRPSQFLRVDPTAGQFLGIDFVHDGADIVLVDASLDIIGELRCDYPAATTWPDRLAQVLGALEALEARESISTRAVQGVGVGLPGPFSVRNASPEQLPVGVLVSETLRRRLKATVVLENNVRLAALAEATWQRPDASGSLLYLRAAAGVGGGVVIDGRALIGVSGFGGEIGHLDVGVETPACRCGGHGCLEQVASAPAIVRRLHDAGIEVDEIAAVAALSSSAALSSVLRETADAIARAITATVRLVDPSDIVLAGPVFDAAPQLLELVNHRLAAEPLIARTGGAAARPPRVTKRPGALGAIQAVMDVPNLPFTSGAAPLHTDDNTYISAQFTRPISGRNPTP